MQASTRLRALSVIAVAAALAVGATGTTAVADARVFNIRNADFANATIPGSTCRADHRIRLHNWQGIGGSYYGGHLTAVASHPLFLDITHGGQPEAFLPIDCNTMGGTAASEAGYSYVVFTAHRGALHLLGVIKAHRSWGDSSHVPLLSIHLRHEHPAVTERIYGPSDADCCPSFTAHTTWWFHNGQLAVKASRYTRSDLLAGTSKIGRARLGMTVSQLRSTYANTRFIRRADNCAQYQAGHEYDYTSSRALHINIYFRRGVAVALKPQSDSATTVQGIGNFSPLGYLRRTFPRHVAVIHPTGSTDPAGIALVRLPHSWMAMQLTSLRYNGHRHIFTSEAPTLYRGRPTLTVNATACAGQ